MKTSLHLIGICAAWLAALTVATAQVPHMISYQGRAKTPGGAPFTGTGVFRFALVDAGALYTYWSNDGTAGAGAFPTNDVLIGVTNGVYSVHLGNTAIIGMSSNVPPWVFTNSHVFLRVWFTDGSVAPPPLTTPDTRIVAVGYAMIAATVVDGHITEAKLADGCVTSNKLAADAIITSTIANSSVTTDKLANNAVTSDKLAIGSITGRELADDISVGGVGTGAGLVEIYSGEGPGVSIRLDGSSGSIRASDAFQIGATQALLSAESSGGVLHLYDEDDNETVWLGPLTAGGGELNLYQANGNAGVELKGDISGIYNAGVITVNRADGTTGVGINGDKSGAGQIRVIGTNGSSVITLDGKDSDGNGRITTQVLEITGGMDLSENFDIVPANHAASPEPGTIVCIDPNRPGHLMVSSKAYDRTVAGVMSGAGGVKPGMLMGQHGSAINGKHPVALTGRVYCQADASNSPIQPGDLLTTSDRPGHAMKVTDHTRAQGAIIGKAMSSLSEGKGLVLVLVSLQ